MVLALFPAILLVKPCGSIERQDLVARSLHEQALLRRVHAFEGIRGRMAGIAVAEERAHVVGGQLGPGVVP